MTEDTEIGVLVLGASNEGLGPGPILTELTRSLGTLPIPVTVVPGSLSKEKLEAIT